MAKRGLIIGNYDTAAELWTLTEWAFSDPSVVANFIDVPGRRKGPLDLSATLTDGDPVYDSRTLTATFETSEGTRLEREERISAMVNGLDGWRVDIILPDDPERYITGRVSVAKVYNDLAHASVIVTAVCEPWHYNVTETTVVLTAAETAQTAGIINVGRLAVVPTVTISGGSVNLAVGGFSWALTSGVYALPDLLLKHGTTVITYSGAGTMTLAYREAVL